MLSQWWVICLCAGWCSACRDYRPQFDAVSQQFPQARFLWVDIEDESDLVGDLDIETFPTLLIADTGGARFLAPLAPYSDVLTRLLTSLHAQSDHSAGDGNGLHADTQALFARIQHAYG